ncbi:hypothetical protein ACVWYF_000441 [Hymenobacter sp. UYAg731]
MFHRKFTNHNLLILLLLPAFKPCQRPFIEQALILNVNNILNYEYQNNSKTY